MHRWITIGNAHSNSSTIVAFKQRHYHCLNLSNARSKSGTIVAFKQRHYHCLNVSSAIATIVSLFQASITASFATNSTLPLLFSWMTSNIFRQLNWKCQGRKVILFFCLKTIIRWNGYFTPQPEEFVVAKILPFTIFELCAVQILLLNFYYSSWHTILFLDCI